MSIFQIISVLFALFMLYVVTIHRKKAALSFLEVSFWISTWFVFIVIALFPNLLLGITGVLRFARVFDLLVVIALMILTVVVIVSYLTNKANQHRLEQLVRKLALSNNEEKK